MPQDGNGYDTIDFGNLFNQNSFNFLLGSNYFNERSMGIERYGSAKERNEHQLMSYTRKGIDHSLWDWGINHCQDFADHARHDCGLGRNGKGKDDDTVKALNHVLEDANNIDNIATIFNNYYKNESIY
jgi:hypothetical protein